jgi:hypothetical protein
MTAFKICLIVVFIAFMVVITIDMTGERLPEPREVRVIDTNNNCCSIVIRITTDISTHQDVYEIEYWDSKEMVTDETFADMSTYQAIVEQYKSHCDYHHRLN